jgi:hypothetical protein
MVIVLWSHYLSSQNVLAKILRILGICGFNASSWFFLTEKNKKKKFRTIRPKSSIFAATTDISVASDLMTP